MAVAGTRVAVILCALAVAGCASTHRPAPVVERTPPPPKPATTAAKPKPAPGSSVTSAASPAPTARDQDPRPEFYTVRQGDTLYSIALDNGLDYRELAEWNSLANPNIIRVGQRLRLRAPGAGAVVTTPLRTDPPVESKPVAGSAPPVVAPPATDGAVKTQPKAVKLPYSEQALTQLAGAPPQTKPGAPAVKPEVRADEKPAAAPEDDEKVDWGWPASGKVSSAFNETANLKGIGIGGKAGQQVIASAPGKVLYSGDGIRGYGKLVIIKHNRIYLSVYAHNSQLLVKEGQNVVKGQKIAEMGNSDSEQVKLHFEIRRFGRPVDPVKLLPASPG